MYGKVRVAKFAYVGLNQTYSSSKTTGMGKTPGNLKNPWEWEKLVFTGENGKNGKNCLKLFKKHSNT